MKKKYQIFISSTYEDLKEERKKVQDTILSMYQFPIGMEMFSAADEEQWKIIRETIDSSDYFVLIIGHRYGSVIEEGEYAGISYTEKEFRYALNKKIPVLAFLIDNSAAITPEKMERDSNKKEKLEQFIKEVKKGRNVQWWISKEDLANKVSVALFKEIDKGERAGWVRQEGLGQRNNYDVSLPTQSKIYPDAIFIGAINYDYIFQGKEKNNKHVIEDGEERLRWDKSNGKFDDKIQSMYENFNIKSRQLGGSAYLALRAFKTVDRNLKSAYVGVCGNLTKRDLERGSTISNQDFSMIDNKDWFFDFHNHDSEDESDIVGKSYVLLDENATRKSIMIEPGINDKLLFFINQEEEKGKNFTDFLSRARWIHITSLSAIDDFLEIMQCINKAKMINPFLKISADLGDEYTSDKRLRLIKERVFEPFDFLFLSNKEKENLMVNPLGDEGKIRDNLEILFQANKFNEQQILVIKHENRCELYKKINGRIRMKIFWHQELELDAIVNDTGAGDFFAGGFIGGMLSNKFLAHQPMPIDIGSIAAKERLKVDTIDEACNNAMISIDRYMKQVFEIENHTLNSVPDINE